MNRLLLFVQRDVLESETSELDARQQQLDAKSTKLDKQVVVVLMYFHVVCSCLDA